MLGSNGTSCCLAVANAIGIDHVYWPGQPAYVSTEASYFSTQEGSIAPSCIVVPESSAGVSSFISTIGDMGSCNFAIKTRGHAPAAGFANIGHGITLDLSWLNTTTISDDYVTATVGAGARWVDVYRALEPLKKTVAGGRNGAVGVGGLTLGGGISYYSPQLGWTCDTVTDFEVVLASGEIVNANAAANPDLFRALKGGGNNLGVVTRIDFKTLDVVPVFVGRITHNSEYVKDVLKAFAGIASAEDYDVHASIVIGLHFDVPTKQWTASSTAIYTLPENDPEVYQELFLIPNVTTSSSTSIQNISALTAEPAYPQKYELFFTSTYTASADVLMAVLNAANATLNSSVSPGDISWSLALEPFPTVFTQRGEGLNVLGTSHLDGNGVIVLGSISWTNASFTAVAQDLALTLQEAMDDASAALRGLHRFRYSNYANPRQDPLGSYGQQNVEFLKAVSSKYDPKGVFQTRVPGGFKIAL